jgi:CRP-like cAMP-binding protein
MAVPLLNPDVLKRLPPFSWLSEEQLQWALPTVQHRMYAARSTVLRAGSPADGIYIVLSGRVNLAYENRAGRRFIAASIRARDFFGEMDLFEAGDDRLAVIATQRCEMLFIPRAVALECLKDNARAAMCMLRKVIQRARLCQRALAQFALSDVYARVAAVLLNHAREVDEEHRVEVGSEEIASLVGSSREMVSRVLKEMMQEGLVRRSGRTLYVLNPEALQVRSAGLL